jgi:hypothetical protein
MAHYVSSFAIASSRFPLFSSLPPFFKQFSLLDFKTQGFFHATKYWVICFVESFLVFAQLLIQFCSQSKTSQREFKISSSA